MEPFGSGEAFSNFSVKFCGAMPAEPPVSQVSDVERPTMRMISAAASVTMAR